MSNTKARGELRSPGRVSSSCSTIELTQTWFPFTVFRLLTDFVCLYNYEF